MSEGHTVVIIMLKIDDIPLDVSVFIIKLAKLHETYGDRSVNVAIQ